jgi:POT family proton-dependent oligopeptide transporter
MWERFSFYGLRAMLVLFVMAPEGFGWSEEYANKLYGAYTGLVYLTPIFGGWLADNYLGTHRALLIGGAIIAAGHFCLAAPFHGTFFLGLALIIIGTGFFKSNVSTMVGQLYEAGDERRDRGYTIFYMGINLGAFFGPIVCGRLRHGVGWHAGFAAAGVGMVLGLVMYVVMKKRFLGTIGDVPAAKLAPREGRQPTSGGAVSEGAKRPRLNDDERGRLIALLIILVFVFFFWVSFEQAGSSMNVFAAKSTDLGAFLFRLTPEDFQSVNPLCILIFAPIMARLWTGLAARDREPSAPAKMGIGMILAAVGFVFMVLAALGAKTHLVSPMWLIAAYLFHTLGELCLSPIGLSLVSKLAPTRYSSLFMGLWFFNNFASDFVAGLLASQAGRMERGEYFQLLGGRADFFLIFVIAPSLAGGVLLVLVPRLKKLMHGVV